MLQIDILMLATDAVYARVPLDLPLGDELGQWEHAEHPRMFIVQPGLYWGPSKPKTRGVPRSFFTNHTQDFETAWHDYIDTQHAAVRDATTHTLRSSPSDQFTGIRLAHSRGKPLTAGKWTNDQREISFDWSAKRCDPVPVGNAMRTMPHVGAADLVSCCYAWTDERLAWHRNGSIDRGDAGSRRFFRPRFLGADNMGFTVPRVFHIKPLSFLSGGCGIPSRPKVIRFWPWKSTGAV